jgi:hypothetical protein
MKLPNDCPFAEMSIEQLRKSGMDRADCCGASRRLIETDEPPLCLARQTEREAYRFIWQSSFDGEALVHIASTGDSIRLRSCYFGYLSLRAPPLPLVLALDDWDKLQCALTTSGFWTLDTRNDRVGLDGAWWLIEGRRGDVYHAINRWSPGGAVRDLGRLFFALAGPPLAKVDLY